MLPGVYVAIIKPQTILDLRKFKITVKNTLVRKTYCLIEDWLMIKKLGVKSCPAMLPSDFVFEHLTLDYLQLVDDNWPHKYPGSDWYFNLLTRSKLGYGLFKGKELLAWVFVKEMGALGHLYTMEKYRRQGYGELVLKLISNILLKEKKYVVAFCVTGNATAANLYKKLRFENVHEVLWCTTDAIIQ